MLGAARCLLRIHPSRCSCNRRLCALCEDGYTMFGGTCVGCLGHSADIAIVCAITTVLVVALTYLVFRKRVNQRRSTLAGIVRIAINFAQLVLLRGPPTPLHAPCPRLSLCTCCFAERWLGCVDHAQGLAGAAIPGPQVRASVLRRPRCVPPTHLNIGAPRLAAPARLAMVCRWTWCR